METLSRNKNKWIRSLSSKKHRDKEGYFIVEGRKMVNEVIALYPERVDCVVTTDRDLNYSGNCYQVSEPEMKKLSALNTPSEILAVVRMVKPDIDLKGLVLALDGIQDPGNLGTIIRTADWFGINTILCSPTTVDQYNQKVIQSTMGSLFRVNLIYCDLHAYIIDSKKTIYGALLNGDNLHDVKLEENAILVIGNEGNGISPEIEQLVEKRLTIPQFGKAESLNAAIATGILLSHFRS